MDLTPLFVSQLVAFFSALIALFFGATWLRIATELTEDSDDNLSLVVLAIGLGLGTFLVAAMCVSWLHATLIAAI